MDQEQLKRLLKNYGLRPNFTYGQNFLIDDIVLQDIADAAELSREDCVLEIGPGIGNLTELLLQRSSLVLSIEKDPKFLPRLKALKKNYKNFRFEIADALEYDFQKFFSDLGCDGYKVVANIPYYITGKILQMLLTAKTKPKAIVLLTQKEVARNAAAKAGGHTVLSLSVQIFGQPEIVRTVSARSFYPAPKVDSSILKIIPYKQPPYDIADEKAFFRIAKSCFAGKRKQIHNTLVSNLKLEKAEVEMLLNETGISPTARPQELEIGQWVKLADKISKQYLRTK